MDIVEWFRVIAAAAIGAAAGCGGIGLWSHRRALALRRRLASSELAAGAAVERSQQARQQVVQLQQELTQLRNELGKRLADQRQQQQQRAQVARALAEAPTLVLPRRELPASGFADTLPLT